MLIQLTIPDMMCSACANTISQAITEIDPQAKVEADPVTKLVKIESQTSEVDLRSAIVAAGYTLA
ncbi:heavy-metal-associated domain-containing protein [Alkalinema sp. FACHB-956]|uniref:heavy-metal-associated domain-containing protein n=1 Tax=Alkalinema sp. FACHB-956 TaxID=2692768 RepID=UPI001685E296|nr:heavy-metal-associated domain-containing protein [Alkalinema sp. FACHB-956]MBD2328246.1 heavy-metal-associated domain-containing protein [Alkalinema sp. FACHB-956]